MSLRWTLRRWSSPTNQNLYAAELLSGPDDGDALAAVLPRIAGDLAGASFLVVPANGIDAASIERAGRAFHAAGGRARLCLAARRSTLDALDAAAIDSERIGLLLDGADADTPLSELVWNRLEAVRFDAAFVARAARDLRMSCVLDAMLGLARDVGLCTLGADAVPEGGSVSGCAAFDYLPVASASPPQSRVRPTAGAAFSMPR